MVDVVVPVFQAVWQNFQNVNIPPMAHFQLEMLINTRAIKKTAHDLN